ncbi:unnamed protein product [Owenia fusiformis]|uniref:Uncharacterized protein n=1 Tax=Owenia fusiformis TaxID=6347 RepID=A0A8J1U930_OWEFU|nr:unnamed protein product [Owenia fusiformis]
MLLLLASVLCLVGFSGACSCYPRHPQWQYCAAGYVVVGTTTDFYFPGYNPDNPNEGEKVFTLEIENQYKGPQFPNKQNFTTAPHEALCGTHLINNTKYLLTGRVNVDGSATVYLCDWHSPWSNLTPEQQRGIEEGIYQNNCGCDVCTVGGGSPCGERSCPYDYTIGRCFYLHSYCKEQCLPNDAESCQCNWDSNEAFDRCISTP